MLTYIGYDDGILSFADGEKKRHDVLFNRAFLLEMAHTILKFGLGDGNEVVGTDVHRRVMDIDVCYGIDFVGDLFDYTAIHALSTITPNTLIISQRLLDDFGLSEGDLFEAYIKKLFAPSSGELLEPCIYKLDMSLALFNVCMQHVLNGDAELEEFDSWTKKVILDTSLYHFSDCATYYFSQEADMLIHEEALDVLMRKLQKPFYLIPYCANQMLIICEDEMLSAEDEDRFREYVLELACNLTSFVRSRRYAQYEGWSYDRYFAYHVGLYEDGCHAMPAKDWSPLIVGRDEGHDRPRHAPSMAGRSLNEAGMLSNELEESNAKGEEGGILYV